MSAIVALGINAAFALWPITNRIYRNVIIVLSVLILASAWTEFYLQLAKAWTSISVVTAVLSIIYIALTWVRTMHNAFGVFALSAILFAIAAFLSPMTPTYLSIFYTSLGVGVVFGMLWYITKSKANPKTNDA